MLYRIGTGSIWLWNCRTHNCTIRFLRMNGYETAVLTAYDHKNGIRKVNSSYVNRYSQSIEIIFEFLFNQRQCLTSMSVLTVSG